MQSFRFRFWVDLALVLATTFIIIWYIFTPSNNQCQMTFMMEPPKFINVPVDMIDTNSKKSPKSTINIAVKSPEETSKYKLFMYSEFGFPQTSDVRHDLRDSMPVLFVPGNAGSYQQVRSLASTCIRRQLISLEAFKFIFYTIDFGGQLSGLSGSLIENQIKFVHQSLKQIQKLHPTETGGVILVGHSVGGFISKALFTDPNFDLSSVPLMINLASPLTMPYLNFDDKMRELYDKTNKFWMENSSKLEKTISISISGGRLDRLVPMHLSMDPQYDLSLSSSSIRDVWLSADHVCITWCRELMHKLANLLSALMDRRKTRLISNKKDAMKVITRELLANQKTNAQNDSFNDVILKDWRSMKSHTMVKFQDYFSAPRSQLRDRIIIVSLEESLDSIGDLIILIDHLEPLKENGIFACKKFNTNPNGQINCLERYNIMQLSQSIPSRRFEPKRTVFKLEAAREQLGEINYIVFDFVHYSQDGTSGNKVPEFLIVQNLATKEDTIYIPSLLQFIFNKLIFSKSLQYEIESGREGYPLIYRKFKLSNLSQKPQLFSLNFESHSCKNSEEQENSATLSYFQQDYLIESHHLLPSNLDDKKIEIKINTDQLIRMKNQPKSTRDSHLEFYTDGRCQSILKIEINYLDFAVYGIQNCLGEILACATYLAYLSIIKSGIHFRKCCFAELTVSTTWSWTENLLHLFGFVFIYMTPKFNPSSSAIDKNENSIDGLLPFLIVLFLSKGMVAFLAYFIKRLVDLASIINNAQATLRRIVGPSSQPVSTNGKGCNGSTIEKDLSAHSDYISLASLSADFGWILLLLTVVGSFLFSTVLVSLFILIIIIKLELSIVTKKRLNMLENDTNGLSNRHLAAKKVHQPQISIKLDSIHELLVSVAVLGSLTLVSNIPEALIKMNSNLRFEFHKDFNFFASLTCLILVKWICDRLDLNHVQNHQPATRQNQQHPQPAVHRLANFFLARYIHLASIAPILSIGTNLCKINLVYLVSLVWLSGHLMTITPAKSLKKKND